MKVSILACQGLLGLAAAFTFKPQFQPKKQVHKSRFHSSRPNTGTLSMATAPEKAASTKEKIYSLPGLYDMAFGYRPFDLEVDFLLWAHEKHAMRPPTRIVELAAGPARHCFEALEDGRCVHSAMALDNSPVMVKYGSALAAELLSGERRNDFSYQRGDMRNCFLEEGKLKNHQRYDSAWLLLGSLQHMTTNDDVVSCFQNVASVLEVDGTLIIELPHPRETFTMGECTTNGWSVPLEDSEGSDFGELKILWGDENDVFDPITQVRHFTVEMKVGGSKADLDPQHQQCVKEIVPMRQFTAQEIDSLARLSGLRVVDMFGALDKEVSIRDEDAAFRLVCVLQKNISDRVVAP